MTTCRQQTSTDPPNASCYRKDVQVALCKKEMMQPAGQLDPGTYRHAAAKKFWDENA